MHVSTQRPHDAAVRRSDFQAAQRIARAVEAAPDSVALVSDGMRCASSCTVVWAATQERLVGPTASLGFHGIDCGDGLLCRMRHHALSQRMHDWVARASSDLATWLDRQDPPAFSRYGEGEKNIVRLTGNQVAALKAARIAAVGDRMLASGVTRRGLSIEALDPLGGLVRQASPVGKLRPQLGG